MTRILDLQRLEAGVDDDVTAAGSSSSWAGCACSTNSWTGCSPVDEIIAV